MGKIGSLCMRLLQRKKASAREPMTIHSASRPSTCSSASIAFAHWRAKMSGQPMMSLCNHTTPQCWHCSCWQLHLGQDAAQKSSVVLSCAQPSLSRMNGVNHITRGVPPDTFLVARTSVEPRGPTTLARSPNRHNARTRFHWQHSCLEWMASVVFICPRSRPRTATTPLPIIHSMTPPSRATVDRRVNGISAGTFGERTLPA
jgi:hypothetical protein